MGVQFLQGPKTQEKILKNIGKQTNSIKVMQRFAKPLMIVRFYFRPVDMKVSKQTNKQGGWCNSSIAGSFP